MSTRRSYPMSISEKAKVLVVDLSELKQPSWSSQLRDEFDFHFCGETEALEWVRQQQAHILFSPKEIECGLGGPVLLPVATIRDWQESGREVIYLYFRAKIDCRDLRRAYEGLGLSGRGQMLAE